jgi:diacylglycerol kinase family enzyme
MQHAALIFNPNAGCGGNNRRASLERAAAALQTNHIHAEIIPTHAPGTAGAQALDAANSGANLVFACGGDGTLHEVIQGLAFHPSATVGILPLGSANALARHLGLSLNPAEALRQQLRFSPQVIPLGRVTCQAANGTHSRYFAVMAGAGPDGALVYRMIASGKHRLGRAIYYLRAARLFAGAQFSPFDVTIERWRASSIQQQAVGAMAVRVGDLGGLFSPLIRGASPQDETLRLALTKPPSHLTLLAWFASSWTRLHRWNPYSHLLNVERFSCGAGFDRPIHVQADGEWIGRTPMHVELVSNALRLLMPTLPPAR